MAQSGALLHSQASRLHSHGSTSMKLACWLPSSAAEQVHGQVHLIQTAEQQVTACHLVLQAGLESVAPTEITLSPRPDDTHFSVTSFSRPRRLRRGSPEQGAVLSLANGGLPSPVPEERPEAAMQFVGVCPMLRHDCPVVLVGEV